MIFVKDLINPENSLEHEKIICYDVEKNSTVSKIKYYILNFIRFHFKNTICIEIFSIDPQIFLFGSKIKVLFLN